MADYSSYSVMQGWELTALFCIFLLITLAWDFLVGLLTFLNDILRGRKANWLTRVKEELLALGVVSLVLLFLEPSLQQICMPAGKEKPTYYAYPPSPPPPPKAYGTYTCSANHRQVFPKTVIHAAHYLLFYLAIVHILFSLLTSVITNVKLSKWSALERTARKEQNIPAVAVLRMSSLVSKASDPNNRRLVIRIREVWRDAYGFVDQDLYSLLRFMCEKRFRAHSVVLRNFNFLNMCEQCLEAELNEVYSHAWLLVFMMALLLLYNQVVYQIVWISGLCLCLMAGMSGNLRWVMKKTAREARNLWRKVQGMGGLERDADLDGAETLEEEQGQQEEEQHHQHQHQRHNQHLHQHAAGGRGMGLRLRGGANGAVDLEAGDVGARLRSDQLRQQQQQQQQHLDGGSPVGKPPKHTRFAQRPVGEALELAQYTDACWAGEATTAAPEAQAVAALASGGCRATAGTAVITRSAPDDAVAGVGAVAAAGRQASAVRARSLVDWLEACRAHQVAAGPGGYGPEPRSCLAVPPSTGLGRAGGASHAMRKAGGGLLAWLRQPHYSNRVGRVYGVGSAGAGRYDSGLAAGRYDSGLAAGRYDSGFAGGRYDSGFAGGGGTGTRQAGGQRGSPHRAGQLPGPVAESTISNPLFAPGEGADGSLSGYGAQLAAASQAAYASGTSGVATTAGVYDMSGGGMGPALGSPQLLGIQMQGGALWLQAMASGGAGGAGVMPVGASASLIAATAAAPYGGAGVTGAVGNGVVVGGQWGSNPSSGNPEEGDEVASNTGSDPRSATSEEQQSKAHGRHGAKSVEGHGEGDEEEDVHSEKSMLEHALASGIEEKITRLFFFGRPFVLLWLFNIIFAQASLTMTMSMAFVIPYDKFDSIRDVALPIYVWLPVVLTNLMLVFYGSWVFLPQYALLSVCGILEPHEVMEEIKRSKTQDRAEEGVAGILLEKMTRYWVGHHDGETRLSTVFIVSLASQAGIILGRDYKAAKFLNKVMLKPMYKEFMLVWHDIAWYGELSSKYKVKTEVPAFREAFSELDEDGSGELSFAELANMIRSLGTYATTGDVEAMLWEIDIDNSHSIGYDEFVKFLVYAFFDPKQLGYIDTPSLIDAMERLGMPINEMQATVLMSVGNCEPGEEVKVTLRQFFGMYEKVAFDDEDEEEEEAGQAPLRRASLLSRARDALQAPSALFLGRQTSISASAKQEAPAAAAAAGSKTGSSSNSNSLAAGVGGGAGGRQGPGSQTPSRLAVVSRP